VTDIYSVFDGLFSPFLKFTTVRGSDSDTNFLISRRWASVFQLRAKYHPEDHLRLIWRLLAAQRRWVPVCQHRASWHPEAFLGLIWNSESSGVVSNRIPRLVHAKYGVRCRRRDAACRFVNIVPYRFPRLFLAWFGVLSRRRFSSVVSCGFPGLMFAKMDV
jgi:hypothetical protein